MTFERTIRRVTADDYLEPLRSRILRGEVALPDEWVVEERIPLSESPYVEWPYVEWPPHPGPMGSE